MVALEARRAVAVREAVSPADPADLADLPELIASIYDTTLSPEHWTAALGLSRDYIGGSAASVFFKGTGISLGGILAHEGGISMEHGRSYFTDYGRIDPTMNTHLLAPIDEPICMADIMSSSEFYDTRFYNEWVSPQRHIDLLCAPLEKAGSNVVLFGIFRHETDGPADLRARRRMKLLNQHIRRAVRIGRTLGDWTSRSAELGEALDGVSAGVFVLDGRGKLQHANRPGRDLMRPGGPVRMSAGGMLATAGHDGPAFAALMASASAMTTTLRDAEGAVYVAHRVPLSAAARNDNGMDDGARSTLWIHRAEPKAPFAPTILADAYGLTPAELRVLLSVVEAGGVREVAEALAISEATVKTHLHRVFSKTGATRQADLVRLVAGFSGPLAR